MNVEQLLWTSDSGWSAGTVQLGSEAQWVLVLAAPTVLQRADVMEQLASWYPQALVTGCSTAGEICGPHVQDNSLVATAVTFKDTQVRLAKASVATAQDSYQTGATLATQLAGEHLSHVMVLSNGLHVNGTALARGLRDHLPNDVAVTGGLAGDGDRFQQTLVCADGEITTHGIVAIGFYGTCLRVGFGSMGGWDSFGPERRITRSEGNVLYELDGQPALELYKRYLGNHASQLPASALLFPLALRCDNVHDTVVRTVLAVDEAQASMTFAGDIPQGAHVTLMKANFDRLVDGAAEAAHTGLTRLDNMAPELAVLISCVGRKLVLKQRIEEEVESVHEVLGAQAVLTGFYSYGEICPHGDVMSCELHNQTMTITTFAES